MKNICIHGHFYQPPREDPWLEAVPRQPSAAPYHDWNARITAECYEPNGKAKILDETGNPVGAYNNYAWMSFNIGPTLLSWLEQNAPTAYARILDADQAAAKRCGGHGAAIAQVYNHMILPLASTRDQRTQVLWGIRDFARRFGRQPEGMWLPETAVDIDSLCALADAGITYTILEPHQAKRWRIEGEASWQESAPETTQPYRVNLPGGRSLAVFFYDGPTSRAIAFEGLLKDGQVFADRLRAGLTGKGPELSHVATDGESYGHHHRYGEMALAYTIKLLQEDPEIELTHYGAYLAKHPPRREVEISENTSWSCAHGIERWRSACGCKGGEAPSQDWRPILRQALDELRDDLAPLFEKALGELLHDPWAARDDYIEVVLDRSSAVSTAFLERRAKSRLAAADKVRALKLLEIQRQAMLMYTSCGWFFDDLGRIETLQIIRYAARAIELTHEVLNKDFEPSFVKTLRKAKTADGRDGEALYRKIITEKTDLIGVAALYGQLALEDQADEKTTIGAFRVKEEDARSTSQGEARLAVGTVSVKSRITREATQAVFGYMRDAQGQLQGGACPFPGRKAYESFAWEMTNLFFQKDIAGAKRLLETTLKGHVYCEKLEAP
jgi:hypothetical protein